MLIYDQGTPGASVSQVESLPNDIEKFSDGIDRWIETNQNLKEPGD